MEKDILQEVRASGLTGFLRNTDAPYLKLGGTAVSELLTEGDRSLVLQGIRTLQTLHRRCIFVVSAAGKVFDNPQKITDRLIAALQTLQSKTSDSREIAQGMLEKLREDHLKMIVNSLSDETRNRLEQEINTAFIELSTFFNLLCNENVAISSSFALDVVAGFGEKMAAKLLSAILDATNIAIPEIPIESNGKSLQDIINNFSVRIQQAIADSDPQKPVVVSGFPGYMKDSSTIDEFGRGYTDFHCVMVAPNNSWLILFKQSGAILQTDPHVLPDGTAIDTIQIMPIRQAVAMTELIGDQIQVIHPLALKEAQRKGLTLMVVDEQNPFAGGTLILPNEIYDQYCAQSSLSKNETLPMMGVAHNAMRITLHFEEVTSEHRENNALRQFETALYSHGLKIIHSESIECDDGAKTLSFIVTGWKDEMNEKITGLKIPDIKAFELGEKSFIVGVSGVRRVPEFQSLQHKLVELFDGSSVFTATKSQNLFSVGLLVPENALTQAEIKEKLKILLQQVNQAYQAS